MNMNMKTYKHNKGYLRCWQMGKECLFHRVIYAAHFGPIPPGHDIHHKNGVKHDNRLENLECLPHSEHSRRHSNTQRRDDAGRFTLAA